MCQHKYLFKSFKNIAIKKCFGLTANAIYYGFTNLENRIAR